MNGYARFVEPSPEMKSWGIAALRVVIGVVFFIHGWQKAFDMGIPAVAGFFGESGIPLPLVTATMVSLLEMIGGAALILGLLTRVLGVLLAFDMVGAAVLVHAPNGFFLPMGYEFVLVLGVSSVALALTGAGAFSLDRLLAESRGAARVGAYRPA